MNADLRKAPRRRLPVKKLQSDERETASAEATTVKQLRGDCREAALTSGKQSRIERNKRRTYHRDNVEHLILLELKKSPSKMPKQLDQARVRAANSFEQNGTFLGSLFEGDFFFGKEKFP